MLGRFSRKSFPLRQLREIDPFENHRQPGSGDLDRLGIFGNSRKTKGATSSRLYQIAKPSPSQYNIFMREWLRLKKTKRWSASGSASRTLRTMPSSPSKDLRMSMGVVQREMQVLGEMVSMRGRGRVRVRRGSGGRHRSNES